MEWKREIWKTWEERLRMAWSLSPTVFVLRCQTEVMVHSR
jgi:hypothetical protein